jgi:hypothetical protein
MRSRNLLNVAGESAKTLAAKQREIIGAAFQQTSDMVREFHPTGGFAHRLVGRRHVRHVADVVKVHSSRGREVRAPAEWRIDVGRRDEVRRQPAAASLVRDRAKCSLARLRAAYWVARPQSSAPSELRIADEKLAGRLYICFSAAMNPSMK